MKRVCIISEQFPPQNTIAARRFGTMIPHFREFGWEPFVVTTVGEGSLAVPIDDSAVFRIGVPFQTFEGKQNPSSPHQEKNLSWLRKWKRLANFYLVSYEQSCRDWLPLLQQNLDKIASWARPDVVIGTFPRIASLRFAKVLAGLCGVPWVADFRDPASVRSDDRKSWNRFLDRALERKILTGCSGITTISPEFARQLGKLHRQEVKVIFNGFSETLPSSDYAPGDDKALDCYYAGRIYAHQLPAFRLLITALQTCPTRRLTVRLVNAEIRSLLLSIIAENEMKSQVEILEITSAKSSYNEAKFAQLNIVLEHIDRINDVDRGILTGKLMELISVPPPILAVARKDSDINTILENTKKGKIYDNLAELKSFLTQSPQDIRSLHCGNPEEIQKFSKRLQCGELTNHLNKLISRAS